MLDSQAEDLDEQQVLGLANYHSNATLSMLQRYDQVEHLIGLGHHRQSEGSYCEDLVRAFLRETLPSRYSVDTGIILSRSTKVPYKIKGEFKLKEVSASPQLDIIIHDTHDYAPVFRTGEFVIVLPNAVRGVVEVKKHLTSDSLEDGLLHLAKCRFVVEHSRRIGIPPFMALVAFGAEEALLPDTSGKLPAIYRSQYNRVCDPFAPSYAVPDLVVAVRHIFLRRTPQSDYSKPLEVTWGHASHNEVNFTGQMLLWCMMNSLNLAEMKVPVQRYQWPRDLPIHFAFDFKDPAAARKPLDE